MDEPRAPLKYSDAGVDIERGDALVERIKPFAQSTHRPGVLGGLGGFGGLFRIPPGKYADPVLVSSTDGVGTKLMLAIELNRHDTIGIDLVAMCANDVVVQGAEPLFFLDYFATGRLEVDVAAQVIAGIADGCRQAGCALLGGETAEMPDMYPPGHYDLAGFCVGVVEAARTLDGSRIAPGDVILGLASSGVHSNGYSLVRRIVKDHGVALGEALGATTVGEALLAPTRIYVKSLLAACAAHDVRGLAHITGGGITGNLPRVLPAGTQAVIELAAWRLPPLFRWLADAGPVAEDEMLKTFNCGLGMLVVLPPEAVAGARATLEAAGETVFEVGRIESGTGAPAVRYEGRLA